MCIKTIKELKHSKLYETVVEYQVHPEIGTSHRFVHCCCILCVLYAALGHSGRWCRRVTMLSYTICQYLWQVFMSLVPRNKNNVNVLEVLHCMDVAYLV